MSVRVFAPAKINLTLEVGAPRADGYHPLQSAVMFADVGDWIEAAPADALSLGISGPFGADLGGADNLVLRAARLLEPSLGAKLRLEKHLPVASGIGGGSSDAAAALKALNQAWALDRSLRDLAELSAPLGADVPACVWASSAWMSGLGQDLAPMPAPVLHAVLVNPGKPLATPAVYRRFDELGLGGTFEPKGAPDWRSEAEVWAAVREIGNDLEAPAVSLMPELGELLATLRADPRAMCAGLSGSGATCFALVRSSADGFAFAQDLSSRNRAWWVRATTLGAA
jgi:4-diphosphocytidyl-2-C-methyl-D-erythritol kinase